MKENILIDALKEIGKFGCVLGSDDPTDPWDPMFPEECLMQNGRTCSACAANNALRDYSK